MIGVDTNILMRYLLQDDEAQSPQAKAVMDGFTDAEPGFISLVTLVEMVWLLRRTFKRPQEEIVLTVQALLASPSICIQEDNAVNTAIEITQRENCDLPDALVAVLGAQAGCSFTLTFDRKAVTIPGMEMV